MTWDLTAIRLMSHDDFVAAYIVMENLRFPDLDIKRLRNDAEKAFIRYKAIVAPEQSET